jgi:hypothetical protein
MPQTREISVLRDGIELTRQLLDLFRLPDGAAAAKWGGLVFPIRIGDCIEVTERGSPPVQCLPWDDGTSNPRIVTSADGTESYIFVEGSPQTCKRVVQHLTDAGFEVLRSGPNLSGTAGDWFIRLGAMPTGSAHKLEAALEGAATWSPAADEQPLRERLLIQALVNSQASQARLTTELQRARQAIDESSAEKQEREVLANSLEDMAARLAEVEAESIVLRQRLESAPTVTTPAKSNRLEVELEIAAAALLPRLDFIGTSMRFISVELPDRAILWKALAALDRQERGLPPAWKSLSGHSGWWERHFSTGQDNQGRIYARAAGTPARWQVLISHKQDQPMDLKRIARM